MNILPEHIYQIEYSEKQRLFHWERDTEKLCKGWRKLRVMSLDECIEFCTFMDKKYVDGRQSGVLPELSVVELELQLWFELKKSRRKLAGRI